MAIGAPHNVPRRHGDFDGRRKNGTVGSTSIGRRAIDAECQRGGAAELTALQFKSPDDVIRAGRQSNARKGRKCAVQCVGNPCPIRKSRNGIINCRIGPTQGKRGGTFGKQSCKLAKAVRDTIQRRARIWDSGDEVQRKWAGAVGHRTTHALAAVEVPASLAELRPARTKRSAAHTEIDADRCRRRFGLIIIRGAGSGEGG
jgi:hypothetical protein